MTFRPSGRRRAVARDRAAGWTQACQGAFLARIGGDEFSRHHADRPAAGDRRGAGRTAAARRSTPISRSTATRCASGSPSASQSIPHDGADAATLIANADAALYRAKAEARGSIRFFEVSTDKQLREKRALQHDLRIGHRAQRTGAALPAAGADRRRDHRLRGAGALASSAPRHGAARRPSSRWPRRAASSSRSANGCCAPPAARRRPGRGRCRSPSICRRCSSSTAICRAWCIRFCWRRACRRRGSSSKSPKAC